MREITERELQILCVQWFRIAYKNILIWHTGNGGKRNSFEAYNLKKMGVLAGVPDLFIAYANKFYHGLFIELKSSRGRTTRKQDVVLCALEKAGYKVEVCKSFNQFQHICKEYISN